METVEVVIRIPKEVYDETLENGFLQPIYGGVVAKCIEQGTVLPKGHGRIGDLDRLYNVFVINVASAKTFKDLFDNAPTIIEADKDGQDGR